jgi:hypothetical protein
MIGMGRRRWLKWTMGLMALAVFHCVPQRPIKPLYNPLSVQALLRDWGDAFNARTFIQLRLLIHPLRRNAFDAEQTRMLTELNSQRIDHYLVGHQVRVNETMPGYEVTLFIHDDRRMTAKDVVVVKSEGRWWFWKY